MLAPIKLDPKRSYRTRCGWPVSSIARKPMATSDTVLDGFPWKVWYVMPNGDEKYFWANNFGRWSNNLAWNSDLDLMESV